MDSRVSVKGDNCPRATQRHDPKVPAEQNIDIPITEILIFSPSL